MRNIVRLVATAIALVVLVGAPALAQSLATPVSNDGVLGRPLLKIESAGSAHFEGSGDLAADTGARLVTEQDLEALRGLIPATAGEGIESVIGWDTRQRVYTNSYYPARAVVLITFTTPTGNAYCSGAMISSNTVLTAGHCVHAGKGGNWYTNHVVYPGYDNGAPFGSCTATKLGSVIGWTTKSSENYDYGAIRLNCSVGSTTGYFGFVKPASFLYLSALIQGYPGDKGGLTQWLGADRLATSSVYQIFYPNDTYGGNSGSAIWYDKNGPYVYGVHAYGLHGVYPHSTYNHGVKFIASVYNNYYYWRNTW